VDTSAHLRAKCYKCNNESIPSHTRLTLNEFQASCYSRHRSQSALSETNWLLRVLGCNSYLESLPSYIDGAPPWAPTNRGHEITSRPLKHDPEVSPRNSKELRTDSYQIYSYNQVTVIMHSSLGSICVTKFSFVFHVVPYHLIRQFHEYKVSSQTNTIAISITSISFTLHAKATSIYQFNP